MRKCHNCNFALAVLGAKVAVRLGAPHSVVQKCMGVKSGGMLGYYASLSGADLNKANKLAF
jgi:hypothetical protein